jgi:hypothetical protein
MQVAMGLSNAGLLEPTRRRVADPGAPIRLASAAQRDKIKTANQPPA